MMNGKALPKDPVAYWPIMSSIPQTLLYEGYGIRKGMWTVSWLRDMLGESLIRMPGRRIFHRKIYSTRKPLVCHLAVMG
ncbi:putative sugar kinase [Escherichia coli]|uniref:Putative sugar kinase n=1 Tax=Escherichia coli TaxID=562 RepID=A0A376NUC3_ECOLX|nr:putative sugar kinase [Escherichia coli]